LTDPLQEVLDVRATEDQAKIPEAEVYAYIGISTSLPDLAVGDAANVGATTSLAIGLGQTTHTMLGSRSEADLGRGIGGDSAPAANELPNTANLVSRAAAVAGVTFRGSFSSGGFKDCNCLISHTRQASGSEI